MNAREMFEKLGYERENLNNDSVEEYSRSETKNNTGILFGKTIEQVYPGIVEKYCRQGLLQKIPEQGSGEVRIALTERGIDVSNVIMADFLLT